MKRSSKAVTTVSSNCRFCNVRWRGGKRGTRMEGLRGLDLGNLFFVRGSMVLLYVRCRSGGWGQD